ncbi:MAG TPA: endonuclease/exonuclease/phosphatase family protein [Solirubrobacteraceae bacterium]|nr:endonuclease/exonuclease/phosphatase family protein [Solirubrobacteraceae bacterium]
MKVLTWNLFHGRSTEARGWRGPELLPEFSDALSGWDWDVALLQEVPPWWPIPLARACDASVRSALTSRNQLLPVRRALARALPNLLKSEGGGCNAILVRGGGITAHEQLEVARKPERRVVHAVRLEDGTWLGNLHASKQEPRARALADVAAGAAAVGEWADPDAPLVFGGDLNVRDPQTVLPQLTHLSWNGVDHLFARRLERVGRGDVLDHAPLSDHAPVVAELRRSLI